MAQQGSHAEPGDAGGEGPGVLGGLASTRPARIGSRRAQGTPKAPGASRGDDAGRAADGVDAAADGATRPPAALAGPGPAPPEDTPARRAFPPGPLELLATAVRTSGQLTQVAIDAWERALRAWLDRLPRL